MLYVGIDIVSLVIWDERSHVREDMPKIWWRIVPGGAMAKWRYPEEKKE